MKTTGRPERTAGGPAPDADGLRWLVLVYKIPAEPTRLRAGVWRKIKNLGAVYLQNAVAALPYSPGAERARPSANPAHGGVAVTQSGGGPPPVRGWRPRSW